MLNAFIVFADFKGHHGMRLQKYYKLIGGHMDEINLNQV